MVGFVPDRPQPLRRAFHEQLEHIDSQVVQLYALVTEGLAAATDAFLSGDREIGTAVARRDSLIDDLYREADVVIERTLALESPMAGELRFLLCVLRMAPELERSGDLVEHIATQAGTGLASRLSPRARGLIEQMGEQGVALWQAAADAYAARDVTAADRLEALDDGIDDLHGQLLRELTSGSVEVAAAVPAGLVARFYERLGDHAVHLTERISHLGGR